MAVATLLLALAFAAEAREPVVGLPCDGCEVAFEGMPAALAGEARIAPAGEPGEPMVIDGVVRDAAGTPQPGIVVYAYQTDAAGIYPKSATRHGALRGWARTGADGAYRFTTIRPGGYPGSGVVQHVHMHVIEPGRSTYYIDDLEFSDDPRQRDARQPPRARGGEGLATPGRDANGTWRVRRDIVLGRDVPGYR
jgi:protocatechuate 3,4-dioxygenase beta subunit